MALSAPTHAATETVANAQEGGRTAAMIQTAVEVDGREVRVAKGGVWSVDAGNGPASSPYLDEALEEALPQMRKNERVRLQIRLLEWSLAAERMDRNVRLDDPAE